MPQHKLSKKISNKHLGVWSMPRPRGARGSVANLIEGGWLAHVHKVHGLCMCIECMVGGSAHVHGVWVCVTGQSARHTSGGPARSSEALAHEAHGVPRAAGLVYKTPCTRDPAVDPTELTHGHMARVKHLEVAHCCKDAPISTEPHMHT